MRTLVLLVAAWLLLPGAILAADTTRRVGLAEAGSEIAVALDEEVIISLPLLDTRPPRVVAFPDAGILRPEPAGSVPSALDGVGTWHLRAVGSGRTELALEIPAVSDVYRLRVLVGDGGLDAVPAAPAGDGRVDPILAGLAGLLMVGGLVGIVLLRPSADRPKGLLGSGGPDDPAPPDDPS